MLLMTLLFVPLVHGADVELRWDSSPSGGVAGYYVLWGTSSGNYTNEVDVGDKTAHTVSGLAGSTKFYFATKAYDSGRTTESALSNETSFTTPAGPPDANFNATNRSGEAPLTVTFNDNSTGAIDSRTWDFGNGDNGGGATAMYTYQNAGTYTVSLQVTGPGGSDTRTRSNYITVQAPAGGGGLRRRRRWV